MLVQLSSFIACYLLLLSILRYINTVNNVPSVPESVYLYLFLFGRVDCVCDRKKVTPKMQGWLFFVVVLLWSRKRHRGAQEACLRRTSKRSWDKSDDTESLVSVNLAPTWMRTRWRVLKGINLDFNPWQLLCDAFERPPRFCCCWHPGASPWMRDWQTGPLWQVQCVNSGKNQFVAALKMELEGVFMVI